MTTICVGCGLTVDGTGKLIVDETAFGADMGSDSQQTFPNTPTAAVGAYVGVTLAMDVTNSSDCVKKDLTIGCTSDLANITPTGQGIEHKIEVSIRGGAFFTLVQAYWNLAWNGSWQEVVIPTGGWATADPGETINVKFRQTFTTFNAGDGTSRLLTAQGSCFGMLRPRSS